MKCVICQKENVVGVTRCVSCGNPLSQVHGDAAFPMALSAGTKLQHGLFTIGKILGQGGFGITYKGSDTKLKRLVAIKELFPTGSGRQGTTVHPPTGMTAEIYAKEKVDALNEARILAQFNHPSIVRVFDAFEENNSAYVVMENLSGRTLQSELDKKGCITEKAALRIALQIGRALDVVHKAGLLHRDIKPDNIFLTNDSRAVLIDFGTAREYAQGKTKHMTAMITPGYAPPEQYSQQAKFGPYTDVYALAATLYHCLTGQMPVPAVDRMNGVQLQTPASINSHISTSVSQAIMSALQLKATDRPQTIVSFIKMLRRPSSCTSPKSTLDKTPVIPSSIPLPAPSYPRPATPPASHPSTTVPSSKNSGRGWWHLIWIGAFLWLGYALLSSNPVAKDLDNYINQGVMASTADENRARRALLQAQDTSRYSIDATMRETSIPNQQKFIDAIETLHPDTDEVRRLHEELLSFSRDRLSAYEELLNAPTDEEVMNAYADFMETQKAEKNWVEEVNALAEKHNVASVRLTWGGSIP